MMGATVVAPKNNKTFSSRRLSFVELEPAETTLDAAKAAVESKAPRTRETIIEESPSKSIASFRLAPKRQVSLNVNVEYAVAMVNEDPTLDNEDRFMSPFGNRRDSFCFQKR
jgi:hypothetical protein